MNLWIFDVMLAQKCAMRVLQWSDHRSMAACKSTSKAIHGLNGAIFCPPLDDLWAIVLASVLKSQVAGFM